MEILDIWTDGACFPNPGIGGWAWLTKKNQSFGREEVSTNNRMEMMAVLDAIRENQSPGRLLKIYSDSRFVIDGCTKWLSSWKSKGWKKKSLERPGKAEN